MVKYSTEVCAIDVQLRCKLRDRRKAQGISQRQLELLSDIPRSRISEYENDKVVMSVETTVKFAILLHCTLDELYEYQLE